MALIGATPSSLDVTLLGRISAHTAVGREVRLVGRHAQALFTLLVLTGRPRTREAIAADLWPDALGAATGPLRQALYQIRTALVAAGADVDAILEATPRRSDCADRPCTRSTSTGSRPAPAIPRCAAEVAVELYAGDLAEGLGHDCFAAERERLSDRFEDTLVILARQREAAGDLIGARQAAERLIGRDPLREEAHEVLIAIHGLSGTRSQVVRQYRRLCEVLARELEETPLPETDATYRLALRRARDRSYRRALQIESADHGLTIVRR